MDDFDRTHYDNVEGEKISDDVFSVCAINAALRTKGVAGLAGGLQNTITRTIKGRDSISKGIKVSQTDKGIILDVYVLVWYGVKIPAMAWDLQRNVKKELEMMTERTVMEINIHVQGVVKKPEEQRS
jgi:uncharacterized alkaline shock family protein YloU